MSSHWPRVSFLPSPELRHGNSAEADEATLSISRRTLSSQTEPPASKGVTKGMAVPVNRLFMSEAPPQECAIEASYGRGPTDCRENLTLEYPLECGPANRCGW